MSLLLELKDMINIGLKRQAIRSCSSWAENYRIMGNPIPGAFTFKYHPWLREMHDSKAIENIGQKSAQMGYTETCLNRTFYNIDVRRIDCLYVLPAATPDATDFSSGRFGTAIELSTHLKDLFSDVENVGHKRAGSVNLYIRGSRSKGGLKSLPVGFIVLDEFDEMKEDNVALALERMSGQFEKQIWIVSTATAPNFGINKKFLQSTQEHFFFNCPSCNRSIELGFQNLVITGEELKDPNLHNSYLKCHKCDQKLNHEEKHIFLKDGVWVASEQYDPDIRGFYVNQMYSSTISPLELSRSYLKSLFDKSEEQTFYNSKLGLPHLVDGAKINDDDFKKCIRNFRMSPTASNDNAITTMGVDVGSRIHYEIDEWEIKDYVDLNTNSIPKILKVGWVRNFEELDELMRTYQIKGCVIDRQPEMRKAKEFADRFFGYVKLCHYSRGINSKSVNVRSDENDIIVDHMIGVDRTTWLDISLGRVMHGKIHMPFDIPEEYREHLKNQGRTYEKDADGNQVGRYISFGPDHFGHARNYAEIALLVAVSKFTNQDIGSFL